MSYNYLHIEKAMTPGRIFVVGDIHGCAAELEVLLSHLEKKEHLSSTDMVVFMGDYVDRGKNPRKVVENLIQFRKKFPLTKMLKGNHEEMLLSYLELGGSNGEVFLTNGGDKTLESYGAMTLDYTEALEKIPREHIDFYLNLERYIVTDDFIFVHAGIDPLRPIDAQPNETIYWIREEFIFGKSNIQQLVVFGHTPFQELFCERGRKLGVDTGAVFGNKLSCVEVTRGRTFQVASGSTTVDVGAINL